jgi:hypothetical protein
MKCSRCKKWIEGKEIKFAVEGDYMGKPLCRLCKFQVEEESREKYRSGLTKKYAIEEAYGKNEYE